MRTLTVFILMILMGVMIYFLVTAFNATVKEHDNIWGQQKQQLEEILKKGR